MKINRLLSDELSYELRIRGLDASGTVAEKRTLLRGAIRCERMGVSTLSPNVEVLASEELPICEQKLQQLSERIQNFDDENRLNEYQCISSRLLHVQGRLHRLNCQNAVETQERSKLSFACMQLMGTVSELNENLEGPGFTASIMDREVGPERSILDDYNSMAPTVGPRVIVPEGTGDGALIDLGIPAIELQRRDSTRRSLDSSPTKLMDDRVRELETRLSQLNFSDAVGAGDVLGHRRSSNVRFQPSPAAHSEPFGFSFQERTNPPNGSMGHEPGTSYRFFDIHRWNVKYDGESSVMNFLERVEELRVSRGVTKDQLLRSAPELFVKDALMWFRTCRFSSWDDLVEELKQAFLPYDYENSLWEEIRKRTQGAKEKVISYVSAMENLFHKLGNNQPIEVNRLSLIRRNLLPYIQKQLALQDVSTVSELTRLARRIEEAENRAQCFLPPPTNFRRMLEPELAYRGLHPVGSSVTSAVSTGKKVNRKPRASEQQKPKEEMPEAPTCEVQRSSPSGPMCWNCHETGHRFQKCLLPRRKFCFKCGKDDVSAPTCPNCKSKN